MNRARHTPSRFVVFFVACVADARAEPRRTTRLLTRAAFWRRIGQHERCTRPLRAVRRRALSRPRGVRARDARPAQRADVARGGLRQRLGLAVLFVAMTCTGFAAYAGYGRMVCTAGGQEVTQSLRRPPLKTRVLPASARAGARQAVPGNGQAWMGGALRWFDVVEALVLGPLAKLGT